MIVAHHCPGEQSNIRNSQILHRRLVTAAVSILQLKADPFMELFICLQQNQTPEHERWLSAALADEKAAFQGGEMASTESWLSRQSTSCLNMLSSDLQESMHSSLLRICATESTEQVLTRLLIASVVVCRKGQRSCQFSC